MSTKDQDQEWSQRIGILAADALLDAGLIQKADLKKAEVIISEEVLVRLTLQDRPNSD